MGTLNAATKATYDTGAALGNAYTNNMNTVNSTGAGSTGGQRMQQLRNNAAAKVRALQAKR